MKKIILSIVFALALTNAFSANYYWVGGVGSGASPIAWGAASSWSSTSGGISDVSSAPGSGDVAIFDATAGNVSPYVNVAGLTIGIAQLQISPSSSASNVITLIGTSSSFTISGDLTINRNASYYGQILDANENLISVGGNIASNATVGFTLVRIITTTNTTTHPNAGKIALTGATPTIGSGITGNIVLGFQSLDISSTTNATFNTAVNASGGLQINGSLNIQGGGKLTMASPLILNSTNPITGNPFNSPGTISCSGVIVPQNNSSTVINVTGTIPATYTMSSPQTVGTINFDPSVTTQANAIYFSRPSAVTTIGSCNNNTFAVAGSIYLNAGIIDDGGNTLTFGFYPSISSSNTTAGNAIHRGTGRLKAQRGGTTNLILVTAGKTVEVNNLEIGASSGAALYTVGAGTNIKINGTLTLSKAGSGIDASANTGGSFSANNIAFTAGKIVLGACNLTVTGSITGGSSSCYIATTGTGKLYQSVGAGATVLLPIGTSTSSYDPATVTPTGATVITAGVSATLSGTAPASSYYHPREWNISSSSTSATTIALKPSATNTTTGVYPVMASYSNGVYSNFTATVASGVYTASVSNFYPLVVGTSDISTLAVNTIIESSNLNIYVENGVLVIDNTAGSAVNIYSVRGDLVRSFHSSSDKVSVALGKGIYLVKSGLKAAKVIL